ncbi:MAG: AMIN domain-containing protein [Terriglobales bacterium]
MPSFSPKTSILQALILQILILALALAGGSSSVLAAPEVAVKTVARVSKVTVTPSNAGIEVEIATSQSVAMRSQVTTNPDRLVLDFPDALPAPDLHNQAINRGEVIGVRIGLFSQNPPVTRVVIDLKSPQPYRIFPGGKTVIVKLMTGQQQASAVPGAAHIDPVSFTPAPSAKPASQLEVVSRNGQLSIRAEGVSLAQVLNEVRRKIGADIPIPLGAAQEQVVANIAMMPVRETLTTLLNGSRFNFILVGSDNDPAKLKSVILTFRGSTGISQPAMAPSPQQPVTEPVTENDPGPEPQPEPQMQPDQPQQEAPPAQETPAPQEGPQPQDNPPPQ